MYERKNRTLGNEMVLQVMIQYKIWVGLSVR